MTVGVFEKFDFFFDFTGSEGQKVFSKHMHFILQAHKTRKLFHDVPIFLLTFLLHPAALHEDTAFQPRPFSLEVDITTLSH